LSPHTLKSENPTCELADNAREHRPPFTLFGGEEVICVTSSLGSWEFRSVSS
jgi:hypothetical protein